MRVTPVALVWLLVAGAAGAACRSDLVEIETPDGLAAFSVEIADTDEERSRGLMFRTDLAPDEGMLFVFEPPREVSFWMKNTPLSLDMLFIDARGRICGIEAGVEPYTLTPRPSGCAARAVLEINGGAAAELGVATGAKVRHPVFGPRAALPCDAVAP